MTEKRVAFVTGASRGIGAAIASRLAADGAKVVVNYSRSEGPASALVETIKKAGGEAIAVKADLSKIEDIAPLFARTIEKFGRLDFLNLKSQHVNPLLAVSPVGLAGSQAVGQILPFTVSGCDLGKSFGCGFPDPSVEELEVPFGDEETLVVVLPVEVYQFAAQAFEG